MEDRYPPYHSDLPTYLPYLPTYLPTALPPMAPFFCSRGGKYSLPFSDLTKQKKEICSRATKEEIFDCLIQPSPGYY